MLRFTVFAGQPKFRSIPGAPRAAARTALAASAGPSLPSSCTYTGTPHGVVPPRASSGHRRRNTRSGRRRSETRTNSVTARP